MTPDTSTSRPDLPQRTHPAHGVFPQLNKPTIVFLTVCTKGRAPWLATDAVHDLLVATWTAATAWLVGRYIVMPDHIHLFAGPGGSDVPLDNWVKFWKSQFTKRHDDRSHRWQPDHWDRRLRDNDSYDGKWEYVRANAVRHRLVQRAEDWPYAGELNVLPW
jgi:putative transposase